MELQRYLSDAKEAQQRQAVGARVRKELVQGVVAKEEHLLQQTARYAGGKSRQGRNQAKPLLEGNTQRGARCTSTHNPKTGRRGVSFVGGRRLFAVSQEHRRASPPGAYDSICFLLPLWRASAEPDIFTREQLTGAPHVSSRRKSFRSPPPQKISTPLRPSTIPIVRKHALYRKTKPLHQITPPISCLLSSHDQTLARLENGLKSPPPSSSLSTTKNTSDRPGPLKHVVRNVLFFQNAGYGRHYTRPRNLSLTSACTNVL